MVWSIRPRTRAPGYGQISFRILLGTTEVIPDFSTVWLIRERLIECGRCEDLWKELQMQLDETGFIVKEGTIQDATFITSDPGKKRNKKDKKISKAKTRRTKI